MKTRCLVLLLMICLGLTTSAFEQDEARNADRQSIETVLAEQAAAWNRGDIEGFMEGYAKLPDLRFASGGTVTYGWQQTLDRYRQHYASRAAMGALAFSDLDISVFSPEAALVFGRWKLTTDTGTPEGLFTLLFRKTDAGWRIVADHTSAAPAVTTNLPVLAEHAMVVTIHHDATDAGVEILRGGGNAVDAAVAVGFALSVVLPQAGNLGGGGFMLIRPTPGAELNHGKATFLDFREKAPAAATADMFLDKKRDVVPGLSMVGFLSVGVPGSVAGLTYAEEHFGKLGLARVMAPAIRLARDGYLPSNEELASFRDSQVLPRFAESRRIFQRDGDFYRSGERIVQRDLAHTLERIAADPADFYHGEMAKITGEFMRQNGGLLTAADLAAYECKERAPLVGHYHGCEVLTAPPPSSGGIVLLEILNILEGYDLPKVGSDRSPAQVHLITEAFRRAYMDRGDYLGDPDFTSLPLAKMLDPDYLAAWRKTIDPVKPSPSAKLERPPGFLPPLAAPDPSAPAAHESPQTTHFSVVDAEGNAVGCTYTLNFPFGSGITVPGLGFLLNDEMDDFASKMGVPNGFGLIQGPANAIAPGKRPLSSMTPTIVSDASNRLRLILGTPGGSTIITTVANDLISILDNGLDVQTAADAPRFHHQFLPDVLQVEKNFPRGVADALTATGYPVKREAEFDEKSAGVWGDSELIAVDPSTGNLLGGQDHRHSFGKAAGY